LGRPQIGLQAQHFIHGTLKLFELLCLCFNLFQIHGIVPNEFQFGTLIPLIKDRNGRRDALDNHRGIVLGSLGSKLFELGLLLLYGDYLHSGDHQFGFKSRSGTTDALYVFRECVNHFTGNGSNVFSCFIDSSKAFDKVVHCGLYFN